MYVAVFTIFEAELKVGKFLVPDRFACAYWGFLYFVRLIRQWCFLVHRSKKHFKNTGDSSSIERGPEPMQDCRTFFFFASVKTFVAAQAKNSSEHEADLDCPQAVSFVNPIHVLISMIEFRLFLRQDLCRSYKDLRFCLPYHVTRGLRSISRLTTSSNEVTDS